MVAVEPSLDVGNILWMFYDCLLGNRRERKNYLTRQFQDMADQMMCKSKSGLGLDLDLRGSDRKDSIFGKIYCSDFGN